MSEPEKKQAEKQAGKLPVVWVAAGLGGLALVGAATLSMRASSPAREAPAAPAAAQVADLQREAETARKQAQAVEELKRELASAKDEGERARLAQKMLEAQERAPGRAGVKADKDKGRMKCPPGDPLCSDDAFEAPKMPAGVAASAAVAATPAGVSQKGPEPALEGEKAIDPNGRFATTYRPGNGHLTAFEAAIAQGILPAADRELVADVGARYAAASEAPRDKALALKAELERGKVQPGGGPVHLRLGLRSSAEAARTRPRLSVHLVMDISGSMGGKPIEDARKAAKTLVDKLAATDDFSLVTFSTGAKLEVADGPVGPRREQIKKTIEGIKEGGGTNIGEGLRVGYEQAKTKGIPDDAVRVVLLLSDGRANEGLIQQGQLAGLSLDAFQDGIQTSTFGIGSDYDGPLMSAIASDGAGGYYYLRDSEQIAPALGAELDRRLDPVATAVEVRVRLKPGVELLKVYGSRRLGEAETAAVRRQELAADAAAQKRDGIKTNRQADQEGGMRFFMPAFSRDDSHALLLKLRVPEGVSSKPLALVELRYKDRIGKKNAAEETPLTLEYAASDADSGASVNASVTRTVQGFLAGEALAQASARVASGNRDGAAALLTEREGILREAAASLGEPLFLRDADRLARMRSHLRGEGSGAPDPLVLAMLLETAARVHLH